MDEVIGHTVKSVELEEHLVLLLGEGKPKGPFTPRTIYNIDRLIYSPRQPITFYSKRACADILSAVLHSRAN